MLFSICWNGKDLENSDFKFYIIYFNTGLGGGNYLPGFDYIINQIFFETIYNIAVYKDKDGFFILVNGDPIGKLLINLFLFVAGLD